MEKPAQPATNAPFEVEAGDRDVTIGVPDDGKITMTSQAAEVSAIRLLDAAQKSRIRD